MQAALSIKNLLKIYGTGTEALKGVSLDIEQGDFFALLGPNGAGKTTLINIVSGLVNKTSGEITIFGVDRDKSPQVAKTFIGVVPQEMNFNIFEKVLDIVVNQAGYYGVPRKIALPRAEKYLRQLDLWDKRETQAMQLSGGMKRRLMIARGLIHEPRLLILDEPTAGVDIELRHGMWDFLTKLSASGVTIILTTHYLEEAEQLCRNLAIINNGAIAGEGSMKNLLAKLEEEAFVLDLKSPADPQDVGRIDGAYRAKLTDPTTLEIVMPRTAPLNKLFALLENRGIEVMSMRNKTNRLEEVFVSLTRNEK